MQRFARVARTFKQVPVASRPQRPLAVPVRHFARAYAASAGGATRPTWDIRMLYDGDCPLCMKEVNFLRSRDSGKGKIDFVDVASPQYDPSDNQGITFEAAMERIHAITADGKVITDIEVFRRLYEVIGMGWLYAITANPSVERVANMVYGIWAKYRMEITGREALAVILARRKEAEEKQGKLAGSQCGDEDTACEIPLFGNTQKK